MKRFIDLQGQRFGKLTFIKYMYDKPRYKKHWLCKCDCGNEKILESWRVRNGKITSCSKCESKNIEYMNSIKEKLNNNVKIDENGCWNFTGKTNSNGYKYLSFRNKYTGANRVAWILFKGKILENIQVLHRCDNKFCINIDHLFLGTLQDNMKDKVNKNRQSKGEKRPFAKLTEDKVIEMRKIYETEKISYHKLASKFGISAATCSMAIRRETWKHI